MQLHEAVRHARQEIGLSQKKLAELAGIQRRQLATLEKGGNVTLATLRKVIAHLPNLESFTIDAVNVNVNFVPMRLDEKSWTEAMRVMGEVFTQLAESIEAAGLPSPEALQALKNINAQILGSVVDTGGGGGWRSGSGRERGTGGDSEDGAEGDGRRSERKAKD